MNQSELIDLPTGCGRTVCGVLCKCITKRFTSNEDITLFLFDFPVFTKCETLSQQLEYIYNEMVEIHML